MKFVMEKAWDETVSLLKGNMGLLATVAGLLVFLPAVAIGLLFPIEVTGQEPADDATIEQILEMMAAQFSDMGWIILVTSLLSGFASLAMMALLRRRAAPTVGQAISEAAGMLPTYLATIILQMFIIFGIGYLLVGVPYQMGAPGWMVLGILILLPVWMYLFVKFSVSVAAIVIDGVRNPVEALRRSWSLTKGNSFRIFFFFLLIGLAAAIVLAILSFAVGAVLSLLPAAIETIGTVLFDGAINLVAAVFGAALTVAIHAQLRRLREPPVEAASADTTPIE